MLFSDQLVELNKGTEIEISVVHKNFDKLFGKCSTHLQSLLSVGSADHNVLDLGPNDPVEIVNIGLQAFPH